MSPARHHVARSTTVHSPCVLDYLHVSTHGHFSCSPLQLSPHMIGICTLTSRAHELHSCLARSGSIRSPHVTAHLFHVPANCSAFTLSPRVFLNRIASRSSASQLARRLRRSYTGYYRSHRGSLFGFTARSSASLFTSRFAHRLRSSLHSSAPRRLTTARHQRTLSSYRLHSASRIAHLYILQLTHLLRSSLIGIADRSTVLWLTS